ALATQLVSGTIKWRNKIDFIIKQLSHRSRVVSPVVLNILRLSIYQLLFLDKVPDYGATNEGVKLAKKTGDVYQAGYVNAILRRYLREKDEIEFPDIYEEPIKHIAVMYSHPTWLVRRWLKRYSVDDVISLALANNRIPLTGFRINRLRGTQDEVVRLVQEEGGEIVGESLAPDHIYVRGASPVEDLKVHQAGLVQVQDASSALVARVLDPVAGTFAVDLCSAPGGKATHIYELARGDGLVVANDVSMPRLSLVKANAVRLGHAGMAFTISDGRKPAVTGADFVLVDAPCSGLGVLARRWDLRWTKRENDIMRMAAYQRELLAAAIGIAKSGGVVVYSTCSIEPEENEGVVTAVLAKDGRADLEDISRLVPASVVYKEGMMQTLPHVHGTDGIFAARLRKR
ncbi:MAG TPA: 16S rRNA (cytosine(967)-C(5))-methyltransferase RsmB, partial [bacterium]|nr:16S rRNA (cytosine(967)-C(5))-methyltransferase RsmB [bacterium]